MHPKRRQHPKRWAGKPLAAVNGRGGLQYLSRKTGKEAVEKDEICSGTPELLRIPQRRGHYIVCGRTVGRRGSALCDHGLREAVASRYLNSSPAVSRNLFYGLLYGLFYGRFAKTAPLAIRFRGGERA